MEEVRHKAKEKFHDFLNEGKEELQKIKKPRDLVKQIPNLFTASRLFLIPFIVSNIISGNLILAGFFALGASVTDMIDGKVARALNATSNFGANLDAVIDKIFVTCVATPLFFTNPFLIIPIFLDMTIATINGYAHVQGIQTKTNKIGKVKTVFLDLLICSSFFTEFKIIDSISKVLYFSTVGLQAKTAKEYYKTYLVNNKEICHDNIENLEINDELENNISKSLNKTINNKREKDNELEDLIKLKKTIIHYQELDEKNINEIKKRKNYNN